MHSGSTPRTYLEQIRSYPALTRSDERVLFERMRGGDQAARDEIITRNLSAVVYVARDFSGRGMPFEDLIRDGTIGLMEAVARFNPKLGHRFFSYAFFWIRQAIHRAILKQNCFIRLPANKVSQIRRMNRMIRDYVVLHGRLPTVAELAAGMTVTEENVNALIALPRTRGVLSLDASAVRGEDAPLQEKIAEQKIEPPNSGMVRKEASNKLQVAIARLEARERMILALRFGLNGHDACTLKRIGQRVGLSGERVRQIEQRALKKVGRQRLTRELMSFV